MAENDSRRLTKGKLFGYGSAAVGDNASYSFAAAFLLFFLTDVARVSPVIAGVVASLGGIWNSLWSPAVGYLSDHSRSRHGRRRPFILAGALLVSAATVLLFTSIGAGNTGKSIYYCVMAVLFWTGYSIFFIPYLAFGAELTGDYDERTLLRSFASAFNQVGGVIGMVTPTFIVAFLLGRGTSLQSAWQGAGIAVAACTLLTVLITWHTTRGAEKITAPASGRTGGPASGRGGTPAPGQISDEWKRRLGLTVMLKEYIQVLRLKPLKYLIAGSLLFLAANTLTLNSRIYFLTYNMGLEQGTITLVYLFTSSIGIVFIPLINKCSKIIGKRSVFISGVTAGCAVAVISGIRGMDTFPELFVFLFFIGSSNSCYWLLFPSMIYDICEVDEFVYGKRREGIVVSIQCLSEALSAALAVFFLGAVLDLSGFDSGQAVQSGAVLKWISWSLTCIPAGCMALSAFMAFLYPLTKKRFNLLKDALEKRANGEEFDKETLKKII